MAIIHSMNVKRFKSFGDLAKNYFKVLLACFDSFVVLSTCLIDMTWNNLLNQQKERGGLSVILVESFKS